MKTKQLQVKTNVRTGAVLCTRDNELSLARRGKYPIKCYIGKQVGGSEPYSVSGTMPLDECLDRVTKYPNHACYIF